jgi:hypothetical protein
LNDIDAMKGPEKLFEKEYKELQEIDTKIEELLTLEELVHSLNMWIFNYIREWQQLKRYKSLFNSIYMTLKMM